MDGGADPGPAARDQREGDGVTKGLAAIGGGDVAQRRAVQRCHAGAFLQNIGAQKSHQLPAVRAAHVRTRQRSLADEIGFAARDGPGQAEIVRRDGAIGFLAHDEKALFGAQNMHRFGAVAGRAGCAQHVPRGTGEARGNVQLEAEFAGKADAEQAGRNASEFFVPDAHVRHRGQVGIVEIRGQSFRRARTLQGDGGPLLGGGRKPDAQ